MKQMFKLLICLSLYMQVMAGGVDLIIFSYNRPLQLYALLESVNQQVTGLDEVMVIFAVDDIVVKDHIDLADCIECMEQNNAYGFFLRLGKNLNYCYATLSDQQLPQFIIDDGSICVWNFNGAEYDWGYPNSLDMTVYRKADLLGLLESLDYYSPNQLEHYLANHADYSKKGVCYSTSKIINLPINLVQTYTYNNCQHTYCTQQLLTMFNDGLKMDVHALFQANNRSSHMYDAVINFIER